jgi:GNAT superfamily N-acetyltransferase
VTGPAHVTVRDARTGEGAVLAALLDGGALVPGTEDPADPAPYEAALAEVAAGDGAVLVAEVGGEVVGVCQLLVLRHLQHRGGRCAELESMHVRADHRGRGIGAVLLAAAVGRAEAADCYRIQLTSNLARGDAHRFYEAHGFVASHRGFKRLLPG